MQEVNEDFMEIAYDFPEYIHLRDTLVREMRTTPRRVLSHHTTTTCQPRRVQGPAGSLKDCGLDEEIPDKNGIRVRLTFQDSFEPGDGRSWSYLSCPCPTLKKAQREACLDILCLLLWCAPEAVHIHPGSMKYADQSLDRIREAARQLKAARQQECVELFMGPIGELDTATPARERPEPTARAGVPAYEAPDPGHLGDREAEILAVL